MLFLNQHDGPVSLSIGRHGIRVAPKATVEVPDGYALPRRADNGSRRPSIVEELAGGMGEIPKGHGSALLGANCKLVPADPNERAAWLEAPAANGHRPKVANMPTVEGYVAAGVPRGQAEMLVRQAHQAVIDGLEKKDDEPAISVSRKSKEQGVK